MKEHHFVIEIAKIIGIEKAIILYNLDYWIQKNTANNVNYIDGKYWTYNSLKAFGELFPYLKISTIKRTLSQLKNEGYILVKNHSENKWDKTNWYALAKNYLSMVEKLTIEGRETDLHACASPSNTNNKPYSKPDTAKTSFFPDIKSENPSPEKTHLAAKEEKEKPLIIAAKKFAEFVKMTDGEFQKLVASFGKVKAEGCIETLDNYKGSTGKKYKSDYRAILSWVHKRYDDDNKSSDSMKNMTW